MGRRNQTDLAVDVVLAVLISPSDSVFTSLISRAEKGDIEIHLTDSSLYCALYSVRENDSVNLSRLAELMRYAFVDRSRLPGDRPNKAPALEAIAHWREVALGNDPLVTIITSPLPQ
jgi:hypothetical protein